MRSDIVLIAMPWLSLWYPSIQLGILKPVLERAGWRVRTRTTSIAWASYLQDVSRDHEPFTVRDYDEIATRCHLEGLGDWIFAVPPFRTPTCEDDREYLALLSRHRLPPRIVSQALRARDHAAPFLEQVSDSILAEQPKVVGFTVGSGQVVPSLALSLLLKNACPDLQIVLGGPGCSGVMGEALHRLFGWIDATVRGDGELIVPALVQALISGDDPAHLPGVCFRRNAVSIAVPAAETQSVPMDHVPTPDYSDYFEELDASPIADQVRPRVVVPFETSRGCWWGAKTPCTFCALTPQERRFRAKSTSSVINDLEVLARRHQRFSLVATDNILNLEYFRSLLPMLASRNWDLDIFYETKANLRREQVALLRRAGICEIQAGIESLSTPILRLMHKGVTAIQNVALLKWCAFYGVRANWNIILGIPGEPPAEYPEMANRAKALVHLFPPQVTLLTVERFSRYHESPDMFGIRIVGPRDFYKHVYPCSHADLMDLAYSFDYDYLDGRDPVSYSEPLRRVVDDWNSHHAENYCRLRHYVGPGFSRIIDNRDGGSREIELGGWETVLYDACTCARTVVEVCREHNLSGTDAESKVAAFFDQLTAERLMYEESGRYLSLALRSRRLTD